MCEAVKRNNAGQLGGQFFNVTDELIAKARDLAPGWEDLSDKKVAQTVLNSVPTYDLAYPKIDGAASRAIFCIPGGQKVTIPVIISADQPHPKLFLDEQKMKRA